MIPIPITKEIKYVFMHHSKIFNRQQQQQQQVKPRKNNVTKIQKKQPPDRRTIGHHINL